MELDLFPIAFAFGAVAVVSGGAWPLVRRAWRWLRSLHADCPPDDIDDLKSY